MMCGKPLARCAMHRLGHTRRMLPVSQRPGRQQIRQIQARSQARGMADWTDWQDAALPFADEEGKKKAAAYPLKQAALLQPHCNGVLPWHCDARMRPSECAMKASAARSTRCPWRYPLRQACAQQQRHHRAVPTQRPSVGCIHVLAIAKSSQAVSARCFWAKCD